MTHDHPAHAGPIGIVGSTSANALAAEADVILAVGTRLAGLHDRARGRHSAPDAKFICDQRRAIRRRKASRARRGRRCAGDGARTRRGAWRLARRSQPRQTRRGALQGLERAARQASGADQRGGPDLRAGRRARSIATARPQRHAHHGGRRPARRSRQGLARQGAEHIRLRVRLLLHGLRDRGRLGPRHGEQAGRRRRRSSWSATAPT